jgi:hypothetical protein
VAIRAYVLRNKVLGRITLCGFYVFVKNRINARSVQAIQIVILGFGFHFSLKDNKPKYHFHETGEIVENMNSL